MRASIFELAEMKLKFKAWRCAVILSFVFFLFSGYWLTLEWLGTKVDGYSVVKGKIIESVVTNAKVELNAPIEISSKFNGKIAEVKVVEGEAVSVGQVLLLLESNADHRTNQRARAATAQAEARFKKISEQTQAGTEQSLKRAKLTLDNAKKQYERYKELAAKGYIGQDQVMDGLRNLTIAQSQFANSQFQSRAARAKGSDYALAEAALRKARAYERTLSDQSGIREVKAELTGTVTACSAVRGKLVLKGNPLMVISPAGKVSLVARLNEQLAPNLQWGQPVSVEVEGFQDQKFKAALVSANPRSDSSGTIELKFDAINPPQFLSQNMNASLVIDMSKRVDVLTIPDTMIRNEKSSEPWVMVAENGRVHRRIVRMGMRGNGKTEIIEGLREGDYVLPATVGEMEEGKRIRLTGAG
jgi:HlyD family secretion protein